MKPHALALTIAAIALTGCSRPTQLNEAPIGVTGKISQGGQPVGDVLVTFQPLEKGHPASFPVAAAGTFQGELIPGNYAYYVGKSPASKSDAAIKRIDPKFLEANLTRAVMIAPDQELVIALD
jgi:hypothetical protein